MKSKLIRLRAPLWLAPMVCLAAGRPADVEALVDSARSAPAEFASDALIRIAGLDRLEKSWRLELLEDAFERAAGATQPLRQRAAAGTRDVQGAFLDRAYGQDLDAMSLRMRAIEAMLPLDRAKARQLFTRVDAPQPARLDCRQPLAWDVERYYRVLGRIAAETFSAKETEEEEPFKLLLRDTTVTSPAQLAPVAHLLAEAKLTDGQFQALEANFTASLKVLSSDDRSFTHARTAGLQIRELADAAKRHRVNTVPLLEAYRGYVVANLTGARCKDNLNSGVQMSLSAIEGAVERATAGMNPAGFFNDSLRVDPIPAITVEEQLPSKALEVAPGSGNCDSPECAELGRQFKALVLKPDVTAYSSEEKSQPEWQTKLKEYLTAVAEWKEDTGTTGAEHFRNKVWVYNTLLPVLPEGAARVAVLRTMLDYLARSQGEAANRVEWFLPVNALIGRAGIDPLGLGRILEEFSRSNDPIISLYGRLERVAPRTPDRIMPLL